MQLDPPCPLAFDNGMRVVLASDLFPKGKRRVTLTLTFPNDVAFQPAKPISISSAGPGRSRLVCLSAGEGGGFGRH